MKKILAAICVMAMLVALAGCSTGNNTALSQSSDAIKPENSWQQDDNSDIESETNSENRVGNTSGNIVNGGWATIQGKQIYCTLFPKESMLPEDFF